jgi:hypothetical protein
MLPQCMVKVDNDKYMCQNSKTVIISPIEPTQCSYCVRKNDTPLRISQLNQRSLEIKRKEQQQAREGERQLRQDWQQGKKTLPGLGQTAANFFKATTKHILSGLKNVNDEVYQQRIDICNVCDKRVEDRCTICGCFIAKKARWASEQCPDDPPRWLAEN